MSQQNQRTTRSATRSAVGGVTIHTSQPPRRSGDEWHNWYEWHELEPDLLAVVAAKCEDALSLTRFTQVCTSWRDAGRADALWKPLLEARFPRATKIMSLLPEPVASYKNFYRTQFAAEFPPRHRQACELDDFIFTVELVELGGRLPPWETKKPGARKIVESWTGRLVEDVDQSIGNQPIFRVPFKWGAWMDSWDFPAGPQEQKTKSMRLDIFVSRCINGHHRTVPMFESTELDGEGDGHGLMMWLHGQALEYERGDELIFQYSEYDGAQDYMVHPELAIDLLNYNEPGNVELDGTGTKHEIRLRFEVYIFDSLSDRMRRDTLLRYLEFGLPWSSAK